MDEYLGVPPPPFLSETEEFPIFATLTLFFGYEDPPFSPTLCQFFFGFFPELSVIECGQTDSPRGIDGVFLPWDAVSASMRRISYFA